MIRLFFALLSFALLSCGAKGTKETGNMPEIKKQPIASAVPDFNADSAYAYVANQVAFGPRVPNTAAHKACGDYLASELKRFGAKVYQQGVERFGLSSVPKAAFPCFQPFGS